jgi:hypothetical protein
MDGEYERRGLALLREEAPVAPTADDYLARAVLGSPFAEAFTLRGDELAATALFSIKIISIEKGMSSCIFVSLKRGYAWAA